MVKLKILGFNSPHGTNSGAFFVVVGIFPFYWLISLKNS